MPYAFQRIDDQRAAFARIGNVARIARVAAQQRAIGCRDANDTGHGLRGPQVAGAISLHAIADAGGRAVWRVKVVTAQGVVQVILVDVATGRTM